MKTKGEIISDLELRFTKGKPSDDLEIERDQIAFWIDIAANGLLSDYLSKQIKRGEDIDPYYISSSAYKAASEEGLDDVENIDERYYINISDLKVLPLRGLSRDYGVVRIHDEENKQLVDISYDDSSFYKNLCFSKPTRDNIQWYRESDRIYLDGVDVNNSTYKKFRVFYIAPIDSSSILDTSIYPLGDDLLPMAIDIAEGIGWKQIRESIEDIENDGQQ